MLDSIKARQRFNLFNKFEDSKTTFGGSIGLKMIFVQMSQLFEDSARLGLDFSRLDSARTRLFQTRYITIELYTNLDSGSKCSSSRGLGSDSKCSRIQRLEHEHFEPYHIPIFQASVSIFRIFET